MKTRNSPKPGTTKKPPAKKTPPKPSPDAATPSSAAAPPSSTAVTDVSAPKTSSTAVPKQQKSGGAAVKVATPKVASTPKDASISVETAKATPTATAAVETKVTPGRKTVIKKKIVKRMVKTNSAAAKAAAAAKNQKSDEAEVEKPALEEESVALNAEETSKKEEPVVSDVDESLKKEVVDVSVEGSSKKKEQVVANVVESLNEEETIVVSVEKSPKIEVVSNPSSVESPTKVESEPVVAKEEELVEKGDDGEEAVDGTKDRVSVPDNMEEDIEEDVEGTDFELHEEDQIVDEAIEDYGDEQEGFEEPGDEECAEEDESEQEEEAKGLEDENMEISALAKERRSKKEQEIFVGGLDRDTVEEDIKKVFEKIGEVVEVRLHKNQSTNKNKGYAFVKFANKEQAIKALSELKNPLIRGKRCGVAPSEDNDTLFVGNICNTWTKEAIKKKLKEYGLEGVENITLVSDVQHEGLSRGFAFVGFSCHADAMLAYKRLQKPDVVFGHAERTVKVAFAEPLRDPDPEIMAQVKSVFIDGLPPHWDEERVRDHFKPYGEIDRIVLARNMPSAKRKDFGFVDFNTHEAAMACINGVNNTELGDEKSKSKVKVRLSNPLPKTQAVKGGLCGGFRIGRAGSGFSRFGRGPGQGARPFNRVNFQRGKDSHARGRDRTGRYAFSSEDIPEGPFSGVRGRRPFGGRGGGFATTGGRRGYNEEIPSRAATSSRSDLGRSRYADLERGRGRSTLSRRQPFSPEGHYSRPVGGRHYVDDPYLYDDRGYGLKRPYSMLDHEPGYLEPNRLRPRFDHPDPGASSRGTRYQDSFGAGSGLYSPDYYNSAYGGGGAYPSTYGGDRSYGGGYYY